MFTRDSIVEAKIQRELELQRLLGKKEALEINLSLCKDNQVIQQLQSMLDTINLRITECTSVDP